MSGEEDMRNWLVGGLVAGAAVTGFLMIVQAAIPDPNGVIHACYRPNGNLRLVDKTSRDLRVRLDQKELRGRREPRDRRVLPESRARKGLRDHLDLKDLRGHPVLPA
jgi:hypothetical protein